jgi:hypothetical protein
VVLPATGYVGVLIVTIERLLSTMYLTASVVKRLESKVMPRA